MDRPVLRTLAPLVLLASAGCHSALMRVVQQEPDAELLHVTTDDHLVTPNTRVDPGSPVRLYAHAGETPWLAPTLLEASPRGLVLRACLDGPLVHAHVSNVSPRRRDRLLKVPGSGVSNVHDDGFTRSGDDLRAWLTAISEAGPAEPNEEWRLEIHRTEEGGRPTEFVAAGRYLVAHHGLPVRWEETVSWDQLHGFKANHFNAGAFAVLVPGATVVAALTATGFWYLDALAGLPGVAELVVNANSGDRSSEDYDEAWSLQLPALGGAYDLDVAEDAQPIFTPAAVRRRYVRPQLLFESGTELFGPVRSASASAMLGVRLYDLWELAGGVDAWWPEPFAATVAINGSPLTTPRPRARPFWLATGRYGAALDLDADRRLMVLVGIQVSGGSGIVRARFAWGIQWRVAAGLFVTARPFTPAITFGWPKEKWSWPSSLEVGYSF